MHNSGLKHIAKQCGLLTAKIYDEIQHDNLLGGILTKLIEKSERNELFIELRDFLVENNSTNFRNELSHGLLEASQIDYYGMYIWWLSLKMILDNEKIFENMIKQNIQF
ncbi:MAG: DUF4209 domain-containing protein [Bacteroidales bacterium]|nr:DUF4209 domain-containing protein [Bacteroidales bacterium]